MKRPAFTPLVYGIYFGMFVVMLALVIYAPVWLAVLGGLAIAFIGAIITDKALNAFIVRNNPFMAVREMNKRLVLAFVPPNRILMFPATLDPGRGSIRVRILKEGVWEEYTHYLTPEQEFQLEPHIETKEYYTIWELLENPWVVWELKEPVKQVFKIEPYGIDTVVLVYPTELITQDQLKVWNLEKTGEEETEIVETTPEGKVVRKKITVPVYSPRPYAISTDNIKQLSAHHRFSTIATILEQTRDILRGAEAVAGAGLRGIGSGIGSIWAVIKKNPTIWVILALIVGGLFIWWAVGGFVHAIQAKTAEGIATAAGKAAATGATKFP